MVNITWFPGHMHKARQEIATVMKKVQLVVEVLDARTPFSSENPLVESLRGDTPCLKLLNKSDLADPVRTEEWLGFFNQQDGVRAISMEALDKGKVKKLVKTSEKLLKVGPDRQATLLVVGIPNVGKSTLINTLAGRAVCKTGDTPAITRQQQLIPLSDRLNLLDTPGFLWPKLVPETCAYRLAITGAVRDVAFEYTDIGLEAIRMLKVLYPTNLETVLKCPQGLVQDSSEESVLEIAEWIGKRRGCVSRGGEVDVARACEILVNDLRRGALGRITWETPAMIEEEKLREGKVEGVRGAEGRQEKLREKKRKRKLERRGKTNKDDDENWENYILD